MANLNKQYEYELAISFARSDEQIANEFYQKLKKVFLDRIFFCDSKQYQLTAAEDLKETLPEIYGKKARAVIVIYSEEYSKSLFPQVEFRSIIERLEREETLWFIVCIDGEETLQETVGTTNYIKYDNNTYEIVQNIKKKMMETKIQSVKDGIVKIAIRSRANFGGEVTYDSMSDWCIIPGISFEKGIDWVNAEKKLREEFSFIINEIRKGNDKALQLSVYAHLSFAFLAGTIYGDPLGMYKKYQLLFTQLHTEQNLDLKGIPMKEKYEMPEIGILEEGDGEDSILIIGISINYKEDMIATVKNYLLKEQISYKKMVVFKKNMSIDDGAHLAAIGSYITKNYEHPSGGRTHLFFNGPAPLMFLLGGLQRFIGTTALYEFKMERGGTYYPSIVIGK